MKPILHLLGKDLRRYAWALAALVLFGGIEAYLHGTNAGLLDNRLNQGLAILSSLVGGILFFLLIVVVVQEENLADPDAYWLGRPVARKKLLVSKILFVAILVGIGILWQGVTLSLNGGAPRLGHVALGILPALAAWNWQIFLAAQTRSLSRYLALALVIVLGFYASLFGVSGTLTRLGRLVACLPADIPAHVVTAIQTLYWLLAGFAILGFYYATRKLLLAWLMLTIAVLASFALSPIDSPRVIGIATSQSLADIRWKIDHLRTQGSLFADGSEHVEIEAVLAKVEALPDGDAWITVVHGQIEHGGKPVRIAFTHGSQKLRKDDSGKASFTLGQLRKQDLAKIDRPLDLYFFCSISASVPKEAGRLDLREGSGHAGGGNRIVVRKLYRNEDRLEIELAGVVPRFSFERRPVSSFYEVFDGEFSFALVEKGGDTQRTDLSVSRSIDPFGKTQIGQITTTLERGAALENYEIIVFSRKLTGTYHGFVHDRAVSLSQP